MSAEKSNVRIVSGGSAGTTRVYVGDSVVKNVVSVGIRPMKGCEPVRAVIELVGPELDIEAPGSELEIKTVGAGEDE